MKRVRVRSSNIYACGYDPETETAEFEFSNGNVWDYWPVKQSTYDAVVGAESIGREFNKRIRDVAENSRQVA